MSMARTPARSLLLVLAASLSAATAVADHRPLTEVSLFTGPDETNTSITASKEGLQLGQTRLEPWPYAVPACSSCNLTLERSFSPVGPDRTVLLTAPPGYPANLVFCGTAQATSQFAGGGQP